MNLMTSPSGHTSYRDHLVADDTQYNNPFTGKQELKKHLYRVADALPPTFQFCIDEIADGGANIGVQCA